MRNIRPRIRMLDCSSAAPDNPPSPFSCHALYDVYRIGTFTLAVIHSFVFLSGHVVGIGILMITRLWECCDLTNVQCTYALFCGGS